MYDVIHKSVLSPYIFALVINLLVFKFQYDIKQLNYTKL